MRWLVRTVSKSRKGAVSYAEEIYVGPALTLGRGAGQAVRVSDLKAALEHARVVLLKKGRYRVEALVGAGVRVDGKLQSAAGAGPGSRIVIGTTEVRFIEPPSGYDAAVEVREIEAAEPLGRRRRQRATSLRETWLGKRWPAWLLFVATLSAGLIVPVLGSRSPTLMATLRATPAAPSDALWNSGALARAHHYFGSDCQACHVEPFTRVRDAQCVTCHQATAAHADASDFALPALADTACGDCHRDHNGPDGLIVARQSLCIDCHGSLAEATQGRAIVADMADFGTDHPPFKVELAAWGPDGSYRPRREALASPALSEQSNLRFPHDVHLDPAGVAAPDGDRVLACGDCHAPEPGGAKMAPVDFETMCQACHGLGFDPNAPEREVPHGDAAQVLFVLEGYYADQALAGTVADATAPEVVRQRRRPGEPITRQERLEITAWVAERAQRTAQSLFEGQACGVCHTVTSVDRGGERRSWAVAPVRVAGVWLPDAHFTHASHTTFSCEGCHAAEHSASSNDVLIPDIEDRTFVGSAGGEGVVLDGCRTCHGGERAKAKVASPCIDCHRYHRHGELTLADS